MSALRKIFHIPDHIMPFALVPIGYPGEEKAAINRYKSERLHMDRW